MPDAQAERQTIHSEADVVAVRHAVRRLAQAGGFSLVDSTKIVTAASELARNALLYGGGGEAVIELAQERGRTGLRITFRDDGPGIPDIQQAMSDGFTTGSGLGLGLSGAKRLVNDFQIDSRVGVGTTIVIARWR